MKRLCSQFQGGGAEESRGNLGEQAVSEFDALRACEKAPVDISWRRSRLEQEEKSFGRRHAAECRIDAGAARIPVNEARRSSRCFEAAQCSMEAKAFDA